MTKVRLFLCALAALAGLSAYRFGGGAEAGVAPPRAGAIDAAAPESATEADVVTLRLVDALDAARVSMPNFDRGAMALLAHWRKMPLAFHELSAESKKYTTSIALRTSDIETQWAVPTSSGGTWAPDARVWNMSEGSFDEREAIFTPTPATLAIRVVVPARAKFVFSPGTANATGDATIFTVAITDARGQKSTAYEKRFLPEQSSSWVDDETVDLAAYSGQTIELELGARAEPRNATETTKPRWHPRAARDGGVAPPSEASGSSGLTLALWGNPEIHAHQAARLPYNVLFVVVDALRPDVIASFHDEAEDDKKRHAPTPPLETLLPKIEGLTPNLDALSKKGVRFTHAYSAGSWTRPGTLAMLSGARSTELGLDPLPWVLPEPMASSYYRSDPPMLALLLRRAGASTRAFVNNYFMVGYAPVGVDMGFERIDDHRYRTKDTGEITQHTIAWLKRNKDTRFFAFCNYNSPHEPWEPPSRFVDRLPDPKTGLRDDVSRRYMAEAAKDDEAIGLLLQTLDELGLRKNTIVVITADHGETLSSEHTGRSKLDHMPVRYHHAVSNYEETTRVPILISLPGVLPENVEVKTRIRNIDIAPTLLELLAVEKNGKMSGASLMPLVRGQKETDERVVLTEGRGTRGLIAGKWRALFREGAAQTTIYEGRGDGGEDKTVTVAEELYDLEDDPGERHNVAKVHADVMEEMRARLAAARKNIPTASPNPSPNPNPNPNPNPSPNPNPNPSPTPSPSLPPRLRLRFVGAGAAHRVSGKIVFTSATVKWSLAGLAPDAIRSPAAGTLEIAFTTAADQPVGMDLTVDPPAADVRWELYLDDAAWPAMTVFAGPFGLFDARVATGLASDEAREAAFAHALPEIDPVRDLGMFVVREATAASDPGAVMQSKAQGANQEMDRLLREWGYAHGPTKDK